VETEGGERLERAIGVIYRPETERASHYFHARLADQFDPIFHIDETRAIEALADAKEEQEDGGSAGDLAIGSMSAEEGQSSRRACIGSRYRVSAGVLAMEAASHAELDRLFEMEFWFFLAFLLDMVAVER
jgi:hypothetical protein